MIVSIKEFPELLRTGIYTLLLYSKKEKTFNIGKLGNHKFEKGYYTYTGSALGKGATSLQYRLTRHLRKHKQKFWYIDCFLSDLHFSIKSVVVQKLLRRCNL